MGREDCSALSISCHALRSKEVRACRRSSSAACRSPRGWPTTLLRLPGTVPVALADWLQRDEVFAEQMAVRDHLIAERPAAVHALAGSARPAAEELLALVLAHLDGVPGYVREGGAMRRPDGVLVPLGGAAADRRRPAGAGGSRRPRAPRRRAEEHVLTGAILCFPSNWTLAEKFGKGARPHPPAGRALRRGRGEARPAALRRHPPRGAAHARQPAALQRPGALNPRPEFARHAPDRGAAQYVRVERQTLLRLPETRAVVFSIHTYMIRPGDLTDDQREKLSAVRPGAFAGTSG